MNSIIPEYGSPLGTVSLGRSKQKKTEKERKKKAQGEEELADSHLSRVLIPAKNNFLNKVSIQRIVTCSILYPCFSLAMAMYSSTEKQRGDIRAFHTIISSLLPFPG